jgi:hypothetical protein
LAAVRHGVADKKIIKEQLSYLMSPEKGHFLLQKFRVAAGGPKNYPAIEEFSRELAEDLKKLNSDGDPLGIIPSTGP